MSAGDHPGAGNGLDTPPPSHRQGGGQRTSKQRDNGDKLPPYEAGAEAGALGCVLGGQNGESQAFLAQLHPEHFFEERHRIIFGAALSVTRAGRVPDVVNVHQWLKDQNTDLAAEALDSFLTYVNGLPDSIPSAANFPDYFKTLEDRSTRRMVLRDVTELSILVNDPKIRHATLADAARRLGQVYSRNGSGDAATLLAARRFNADLEPPPLRSVFTLDGRPISTVGNLTTITSAIKTGKSAVIGAMAAAAMPHSDAADLLGFNSSNTEARALLWFDSEQSPDDFWHCVYRAIKRANLEASPDWLRAYCLTGLGCKRAWECVKEDMRAAKELHQGIHSILLDGAADFVNDVNDAAESNAFVAELHDLAILHQCPIIGVIHFNPGSEKSRGHLGSQLERKAETNLRLDKTDGVTTIWSDKQRRAPIPKDLGPCFEWSDEAGMHVTTQNRQETKDRIERETLLAIAEEIFADHPSMRWSDLQSTVKKRLTVSDKTAERKVEKFRHLGIIKKSVAGLYVLNT